MGKFTKDLTRRILISIISSVVVGYVIKKVNKYLDKK